MYGCATTFAVFYRGRFTTLGAIGAGTAPGSEAEKVFGHCENDK